MANVQVVTGGTSGMGLAAAIELGAYGPVVVGGRSAKRIESALEELKAAGVEAFGFPCDISDAASLAAFADKVQEIGEIGNVVNAAGVDFDSCDSKTIVDINMVGTVNVVNAFLPLMTEGTICNFSSIAGYYYEPLEEEQAIWNEPDAADFAEKAYEQITKHENPLPGRLPDSYPAYCGSKQFVIRYTQANTQRCGARGVRIVSIAPGSFLTPMLETQKDHYDSIAATTAFKRLGTAQEMGRFVAHVLDPEVSYLTGCDIVMDGGKLAMSMVKQLA